MKKVIYISLFTALVIFNMLMVVGMVSSGGKITELEKQKLTLIKENQEVRDTLIKISSLTELEKKANNLGYLKPSEKLYINDIDTVAFAQ